MILLDTHIWFWWVQAHPRLSIRYSTILRNAFGNQTIAVSAFSCWEVAMMFSKGRVTVDLDPLDWITSALTPSGIELLPLTPQIAAESVTLPGDFHNDPADRIIVATARLHSARLMTEDAKILAYPHVNLAS